MVCASTPILGMVELNRVSSHADEDGNWTTMQSTKAHTNGKVEPGAARDTDTDSRARPAPGARLAAAFEAVEKFPVLMESRARVVRAATAETSRVPEVIEAVE